MWILESSSHFSIKIAYHAQNAYYFSEDDALIWKKLWSLKIYYRLKVTLWHFAKGVIHTRERIQNFANLIDTSCPLYLITPKIELHIFLNVRY